MKLKIFFSLLIIFTSTIAIHAESIFQIGIWFDFPESTTRVDVTGLKLGLPISSGRASVFGIECSIFESASRDVTGLQSAILFNQATWVDGCQAAALVNKVDRPTNVFQVSMINLFGNFQLGAVNISDDSTLQLGLLNFNKKGFIAMCPLINFSVGD